MVSRQAPNCRPKKQPSRCDSGYGVLYTTAQSEGLQQMDRDAHLDFATKVRTDADAKYEERYR
jgi:hypothetical protein